MRKDWRDVLYSVIVGIPIAVVMYLCYTREILSLEVIAIIAIAYGLCVRNRNGNM